MTKAVLIILGSLGAVLFWADGGRAQTPTIEELRRENQDLKEQLRLIVENNELKSKIEAARKGQPVVVPESAVSPAPTATQPTAVATPPAAALTTPEIVTKIEGVVNLFKTDNGTVISSVCEQQNLELDNYNVYDKEICSLAQTLVRENRRHGKVILEPGQARRSTMIFVLADLLRNQPTPDKIEADLKRFILDSENNRNDKQVGGDSKSAGTTSLAVKGGIPRFLGWAVENGAATSARSGNTLTFRVNPAGLIDSMSRDSLVTGFGVDNLLSSPDSFTDSLRKFSVGFSFDIARGTETPTFIGSKQQLSAFSVRYNFFNKKDPLHPAYIADWERFRTTALSQYATRIYDSSVVLVCNFNIDPNCDPTKFLNADLEEWRAQTEVKLQEVKLTPGKSDIELVESVRKIIVDQIAKLPMAKLKADQAIVHAVTEQGVALLDYVAEKRKLEEKIAKGEVLTIEYTNYREVNAPDISNFRFIAEKGFGNDWNLTANASISVLNKKPSGLPVNRIRDFDFTLQLERPLMQLSFGRPIFSFSGQYRRLPGNIIGPDGLLIADSQGDTAVGQLKLVIPINGTGIKLPFSVTFANRSDLVKESTVRGNFGFTFDLDRLLLGRKLF